MPLHFSVSPEEYTNVNTYVLQIEFLQLKSHIPYYELMKLYETLWNNSHKIFQIQQYTNWSNFQLNKSRHCSHYHLQLCLYERSASSCLWVKMKPIVGHAVLKTNLRWWSWLTSVVFLVQAVLRRQAFLSFVFLHLMLQQFSLSCANLCCIKFSKSS